jgi:hypothetical protein
LLSPYANPLTDPAIPYESREDRAKPFRDVFGWLASNGLIRDCEKHSVAARLYRGFEARGFTRSDLAALKRYFHLSDDWTPQSGYPFGLRSEAWPVDDWQTLDD